MMTFERFMSQLSRPLYVVRMAHGKMHRSDAMGRGANTAYAKAQRQIDDLVLQRALVIADERRCASLGKAAGALVPAIRCEYQRGHDPVPGRRGDSTGTVMHDRKYDHGAPSVGVWWMQPEEAMA